MADPKNSSLQSDVPVQHWSMFFTGFMQTEGGHTALERVHRRVTRSCSGPDTIITLNSWRDSVKDKAQRISNWRNEFTGVPPRVVVVGFSYGGWSANSLCRALQSHDIPVEALLLCDPVGRWFGSLPTAFSMLNVIPLTVPANVRNLYTWRQTFDRPRGGAIRLEKEWTGEASDDAVNEGTKWHINKTYKYISHVNLDDLPEWQIKIIQLACPEQAVLI